MRNTTILLIVFINLIFFVFCSYMYMLWSQYWTYLQDQVTTPVPAEFYERQIYEYNRAGVSPTYATPKSRSKHSVRGNVTLNNNSKPRFPNLQPKTFEMDTTKYTCHKDDTPNVCNDKTMEYKENIINELKKVFLDESRMIKVDNPYNVRYEGPRDNFMNQDPRNLMCDLKATHIDILKREAIKIPWPLKQYLPKKGFFENKRFNSCAIVASSGALKYSGLGNFIDSHDLILRFNDAPTKGFENDVGRKTTVRVVNSQVVTRTEFNFLRSDLYKNITVVVWDPSNYSSTVEQWLGQPDFNFFPNFVKYRQQEPKPRIFIVNPRSVWAVWDFLQMNSPNRLRPNPPSSGFLGIRLLLPYCNFVDVIEYVPSTRVTKRCHYYDPATNPACTFGVWHPLAAEKLLVYHVNSANDFDVFQKGYVRLRGFKHYYEC